MKVFLIDVGSPGSCQPLTATRTLGECPVANEPLQEVTAGRLVARGCEVLGIGREAEGEAWIPLDSWLSEGALQQLLGAAKPTVVVGRGDGEVLAWTGREREPGRQASRIQADGESFKIRYPWDLLRVNEILVGALPESKLRGEVHPAAHIEGTVVLGERSRLLPGVFIEGNAVIGRNCKIGPNCYIRGNTSIGDRCHIGQAVEIKNCIVMSDSSIGHLSYCGDSILGRKVNLGAGTITANFRHDGMNHRSMVDGASVDTGRRKFGVVAGDHVHTGIHTSLYPGRKLWPGTSTRPGEIVERDKTAR